MVVEIIKQGGFALLSAAMFVIYRNDSRAWASKQAETVSALMDYSAKTSATLTQIGQTQAALTTILGRIEAHLDKNHLCPVTQVSSELLRDAGGVPGRRQIDRVVRDAISSAVIAHAHADGE